MSKKVFNKPVPDCKYCAKGMVCKGSELVVCGKHGVVKFGFSCKSFKYNPLKRIPEKYPVIEKLEYDNFIL